MIKYPHSEEDVDRSDLNNSLIDASVIYKCQIYCLKHIYEPIGIVEIIWQFRCRIRRMIKRRINYLQNWLFRTLRKNEAHSTAGKNVNASHLKPGDSVRVKSREEIQATLDLWNELKGCGFMEEMWSYCGTKQKVYKQVEKFLDENQYRIRKSKGLISLEGAICQGTVDFGPCDRSCFFFWREEWLEKIS